jgi:hypothetical protein
MMSLAFLIPLVRFTSHELETDTLKPAMMHSPGSPLLWSFDMVSSVVRSLVDLMFSHNYATATLRRNVMRNSRRQAGWGGGELGRLTFR